MAACHSVLYSCTFYIAIYTMLLLRQYKLFVEHIYQLNKLFFLKLQVIEFLCRRNVFKTEYDGT